MQVRQITLREIRMMLIAPFETSFGVSTQRRILLVEADLDGVICWGEAVAGETPYYAPETTETAWHIRRDFIWPTPKGRDFQCASDLWGMVAPIRGPDVAKEG